MLTTEMVLLWLWVFARVILGESCGDGPANCTWPYVSVDPPPECSGSCTTRDCCVLSCDNWASSNAYPCSQVFGATIQGKVCADGVCNVTTCCTLPETCDEAMRISTCPTYLQVFASERPNFNESCAGVCDEARCCRPLNTCGEYESFTSFCAMSGLFVIPDKPCSGAQCRNESCCRGPQTCGEYPQLHMNPCDAGFKFKMTSDELNDQCPNGVCTNERCCEPTTTCGEAERSISPPARTISSQCASQGLALSPPSSCTYPDNCTASVCCTPPTNCDELSLINSSCADGLYFDPYAQSSDPFNASVCCRPPQTCPEALQASPDYCVRIGKTSDYSRTCDNGVCTTDTCCRSVDYCFEVSGLISCGPFTYFDSSHNCSGNCSAATCCAPAYQCAGVSDLVNICQTAGLFPNYVSCSPSCNISTCCKPFTCADYLSAQNGSICNPQSNSYPQLNRPCNSSTCSSDLCCGPPSTCYDLWNSGSSLCKTPTLTWLNPRPMSQCLTDGQCSVTDCCREKQCTEWFYDSSDNANECRNIFGSSMLFENRCVGGICDATQCCSAPKTCDEIARSGSNFCPTGFAYAVGSAGFNDTCPGGCDEDRCCRPVTNCGEIGSYFCESQSLFLISNKSCSGMQCLDKQTCCRGPQSCVEVYRFNYSFCRNGYKYKPWSGTLCPNGICTNQDCCEPTTTCEEADLSMQYPVQNLTSQCRSRGLILSPSHACTYPSTCNTNVCCIAPTNCYQYALINSTCPNNYYFDTNSVNSSVIVNASSCCRPSRVCYEVPSNFCSDSRLAFDESSRLQSCPESGCTTGHCCHPAEYCSQTSSWIKCEPFARMDAMKPCSGNCSFSTCCEPVSCSEVYSLAEVCSTVNKFPDWDASCYPNCGLSTCCREHSCSDFFDEQGIDGAQTCALERGQAALLKRKCTACSLDTCCGAPSTCADANSMSGYQLCQGVGVVNANKSCSGSTCNPAVCCIRPSSCNEVREASSRGNVPSPFCARDGFADNFYSPCDGPCTVATCCETPTTCQQLADIIGARGDLTGSLSAAVCKNGYFDTYLPCPNGVCDDTSCCRPPVYCGESSVFCGGHGVMKGNERCGSTGCNIATCCRNATACAEDEFLCLSVGKVNTGSTSLCVGGVCTAESCCRAPKSCEEVSYGSICPAGAVMNTQKNCSGTTCNTNHCCERAPNCYGLMEESANLCKGRFVNVTASFLACPAGVCSEDFCCRTVPMTCGEASSQSRALCGGAVDFFKPCIGSQCTDVKFCCRPPSNCREAIGSRNVTCGAGWTPATLNQASCPSGVCDATTCCKKVVTCRDASAAVEGGLCASPAILNPTQMCGGDSQPVCDAATCCRAPLDCGEATGASSAFCSGALPMVKEQAAESLCAPGDCTPARCCRAPEFCAEAYFLDMDFCSKQGREFNKSAFTQKCTTCATECCIAKTTFSPTSQPDSPTPRPPSSSNNCPHDALRVFLSACKESDFQAPHTSCTTSCKDAGRSLFSAFAPANVSSVSVCLNEVASAKNLSASSLAYVVKQVEANAPLCGVPTTINASPLVTYSTFVLGLALIVMY